MKETFVAGESVVYLGEDTAYLRNGVVYEIVTVFNSGSCLSVKIPDNHQFTWTFEGLSSDFILLIQWERNCKLEKILL